MSRSISDGAGYSIDCVCGCVGAEVESGDKEGGF